MYLFTWPPLGSRNQPQRGQVNRYTSIWILKYLRKYLKQLQPSPEVPDSKLENSNFFFWTLLLCIMYCYIVFYENLCVLLYFRSCSSSQYHIDLHQYLLWLCYNGNNNLLYENWLWDKTLNYWRDHGTLHRVLFVECCWDSLSSGNVHH